MDNTVYHASTSSAASSSSWRCIYGRCKHIFVLEYCICTSQSSKICTQEPQTENRWSSPIYPRAFDFIYNSTKNINIILRMFNWDELCYQRLYMSSHDAVEIALKFAPTHNRPKTRCDWSYLLEILFNILLHKYGKSLCSWLQEWKDRLCLDMSRYLDIRALVSSDLASAAKNVEFEALADQSNFIVQWKSFSPVPVQLHLSGRRFASFVPQYRARTML